jgi:hypothetical protein
MFESGPLSFTAAVILYAIMTVGLLGLMEIIYSSGHGKPAAPLNRIKPAAPLNRIKPAAPLQDKMHIEIVKVANYLSIIIAGQSRTGSNSNYPFSKSRRSEPANKTK